MLQGEKNPKPQKGTEDKPEKLQTKSSVVGNAGKYYRQGHILGEHLGKLMRQTIAKDKPWSVLAFHLQRRKSPQTDKTYHK